MGVYLDNDLRLSVLVNLATLLSLDKGVSLQLLLSLCAFDPFTLEAGMAKGAELDWEETLQELLKSELYVE
jgi:hypothetical protein